MMQKIRILFLIALGSSLLLSAYTRGIPASAMQTTVMSVDASATLPQQSPELAYNACARCHPNMKSMVNSLQFTSISFQERLFDKSALSRTQEEMIDEQDLFIILMNQHHAQSAPPSDFSGPIVQCSFCHPGAVERVLSAALYSN